MLKVIMISAILSAIVAILTEIFCSDQRAKTFWLGSISLYFIISCVAFNLLWKGNLVGNIAKQILIFVVVGMSSFLCSVVVASVIMTLIDAYFGEKKPEKEEAAEAEEVPDENS